MLGIKINKLSLNVEKKTKCMILHKNKTNFISDCIYNHTLQYDYKVAKGIKYYAIDCFHISR